MSERSTPQRSTDGASVREVRSIARLEGKVALVTGSGRGIGRAVAHKLAAEGAKLVINGLDPEPSATVVEELQSLGGEAVACVGSVTVPAFAQRFIDCALSAFGRIDIIVNNAGYSWDGASYKMTDEQFQAMLDVHLMAPFRILRAAALYFRESAQLTQPGAGGHRKVVNISSVAALSGNPGQANYASAKLGVVGLTRTLAKEWARYRVNVNCVAFGPTATRMSAPTGDSPGTLEIDSHHVRIGVRPEALEAAAAANPFGRIATAEDAAGAVYLFCIPESDFVSGEVMVCAGGATF